MCEIIWGLLGIELVRSRARDSLLQFKSVIFMSASLARAGSSWPSVVTSYGITFGRGAGNSNAWCDH